MFELLRRGQLKQCLVFLGEPGIESGQNNADYMMSTSDDTDNYGVNTPGATRAHACVCAGRVRAFAPVMPLFFPRQRGHDDAWFWARQRRLHGRSVEPLKGTCLGRPGPAGVPRTDVMLLYQGAPSKRAEHAPEMHGGEAPVCLRLDSEPACLAHVRSPRSSVTHPPIKSLAQLPCWLACSACDVYGADTRSI